MWTHQTRHILLISKSLLAVWLFFGGLALLDQLRFTQDTSAQDEHALLELASGLKSDVPCDDGKVTSSVCADASVPLVLLSLEHAPQGLAHIVHAIPTLRLHQLTSVYRI